MREGLSPKQIRDRIKIGDETTLLSAPGLHLLSGHVGKGQQFDWVVVVGAEDGVIPDFRATTAETRLEEARVLSVMISRARHGVVVTCSRQVPTLAGRLRDQNHSPFFTELKAAAFANHHGVTTFFDSLDWEAVATR